jgi:hypothetical protein
MNFSMCGFTARGRVVCALALLISALPSSAGLNVMLTEVPDYLWYAGCFGTASGNLMGYWDRHGFPNFYTGPTAEGVAPLDSRGNNFGICSLWASQAGFDGRPADRPGHIDDYWIYYHDELNYSYESTAPDPYLGARRPEHAPDCIGDFIGLSQKKWTNLNGECDGNVDAMAFVFWDANGDKRVNFVPSPQDGKPVRDIPSGYIDWTRYRGDECEVFSQLTDFNPNVPAGRGFTFEDMKAEIDAGYPVLLYMQRFDQFSRSLPDMPRANPYLHGMLAYGYYLSDDGERYVRYKTSWGSSGDNTLSKWGKEIWQAQLPVRGVIGYHPMPKITKVVPDAQSITIEWHGPSSVFSNMVTLTAAPLHWYVVEKSSALYPTSFVAVSEPTWQRTATISNCCEEAAFFRVKLVPPPTTSSNE